MKKLFALLLMLALLLGSVAIAEQDYTGLWTLSNLEMDGISVTASALGVNGSLLLNGQGSCLFELHDMSMNGTWAETEDGIVLSFGYDTNIIFTHSPDVGLTTEVDGMTMTFILSLGEDYSRMLAGQTVEDFNGEWVFVNARHMGQVTDAETMGTNINLHIQDGKAHVEQTCNGTTEAIDAVCEIEEVDPFTAMYLVLNDPATDEPTGNVMVLTLLDNGKLVWWASDDAGSSIFYNFENVANVQN